MTAIKKSVSGEGVVAATTVEEMKADFLNRVEKMYDFVKGMGEDLKIKRFFSILDEMTHIAREINEKGLLEDEQMLDVWELIMMFDDSVAIDMPIDYARKYLETRLSSIIKTLQGENVVSYGQNCSDMEDTKMNIGRFDMYYEEFENVKDGQYVIFAECADGQLLIGEVDRCGFDDLDYAIAIRDAHSFEYGVEVSVYLVKKEMDEYGVVTNELIKCIG